MKTLPVLITALGVAAGAVTAASPAANASTTSLGYYYHGTASMAWFRSWGVCQQHAEWARNYVTARGGRMAPSDGGFGSSADWKCFPTAQGTWTYMTVYAATRPLIVGDRSVSTTLGADNLVVYHHVVTHPAATYNAAQCMANFTNMTTKVINSLTVRLLPSAPCTTIGATRGYEVDYLGPNTTSGFYGDRPYLVNGRSTFAFSEAWGLGYKTQAD